MKFSSSEILPAAESTGFKAEMVEKVLHLLNLLTTLNSHPFLKGKWVLKGGTADSHPLGDFHAKSIPVLDLHELAAGKLAALLARGKARDLFDCHRILNMDDLERDRLRIAFVVYGGMNRKDWRTVSIEDVDFDAAELARQLIPNLHIRAIQEQGSPAEYGAHLVEECRKALSVVLPFTDAEREFLDLLLDKGKIDSTILTADTALQQRIQSQPLLEWKALNVQHHKGLS